MDDIVHLLLLEKFVHARKDFSIFFVILIVSDMSIRNMCNSNHIYKFLYAESFDDDVGFLDGFLQGEPLPNLNRPNPSNLASAQR